jgi:hypothetical protein
VEDLRDYEIKAHCSKYLLGTGLYLLDPVRDRLADRIESLSDRAKDVYGTASGHVRKISRSITGDDHSGLGSAAALLFGVGVGVGLGILFVPASGKEIRRNIAGKVQEFGGRIRRRASGESQPGSGTD